MVGKRGLYGAISDVACPDYEGEGAAGKSEHVQEQVRPRLRARGGKPQPRGDVDGPLGRREVLLASEERDGRVRHRKSRLTDRNAAGALTFRSCVRRKSCSYKAKPARELTPAVAYLRTSSAANVGADKDSERRQREAVEGFARRAGYEIVGEFHDAAVAAQTLSMRGPVSRRC